MSSEKGKTGSTKIRVRVCHEGGCGIGGEHLSKGEEFNWDEGRHGDTLNAFIKEGLLERVKGDAKPEPEAKPEEREAAKSEPEKAPDASGGAEVAA